MFERKGMQTFESNIFPLPTAIFWRSIFPLAAGAGTGAGHADRSCVDAIFWRAADFAANVVPYQAARLLPETSGWPNARGHAQTRRHNRICLPEGRCGSSAGKDRNHAETALRSLRGLCAGEAVGHAIPHASTGTLPFVALAILSAKFSDGRFRKPRRN